MFMDDSSNNVNEVVKSASPIVVNSVQGKAVDREVVKKNFYNAFQYSLPPGDFKHTIGITSPNPKEGKTVAACNLASSFAIGHKRKTILVDLNIEEPRLHDVFETEKSPGLTESMQNGSIHISRTKFEQLYLLPAGRPSIGLDIDDVIALRDVIYSLRQEFEFVIMDMGPTLPVGNFPLMLVNELDSLLVVVDTTKTKYGDIQKVFRHVNNNKIYGFIYNRVQED
ncbi:MAG: hypothetical protein K9N57_00140 [Candidatus Marinimicrobia bacterium]|nr:hypothetical protein [Candidatus Neomarinimicrobiota bacterium]